MKISKGSNGHYLFDFKRFIRTILIFVCLSTVWTTLGFFTYNDSNNYGVHILNLGFLTLFALSIYWGMSIYEWRKLVLLIAVFILIFLLCTFVIWALAAVTFESTIAYAILSSVTSSCMLTLILDKMYGIQLKLPTIILTGLFILAAYCVIGLRGDDLKSADGFGSIAIVFDVYQFFAIIPLAVGLNLSYQDTE